MALVKTPLVLSGHTARCNQGRKGLKVIHMKGFFPSLITETTTQSAELNPVICSANTLNLFGKAFYKPLRQQLKIRFPLYSLEQRKIITDHPKGDVPRKWLAGSESPLEFFILTVVNRFCRPQCFVPGK